MKTVSTLNLNPVHTSVFGSYGTGTVPLHLSTSVNIAHSVPFRSDPSILWGLFRNKLFRCSLERSVCNVDRWIGTVPVQVWTHAVPYRSKLYRNSLYRYGTAPDVEGYWPVIAIMTLSIVYWTT